MQGLSTALQLNREFLRGRHTCTPYHGPLDPETADLLDGLHRLHDFGFLTNQSQPSQHDEPFFVVEPTRGYSENQALVGFTNRMTSFLDPVEHLERELSLEPEKLEDPVNDLVSNRRLLDPIGICTTGLEGMASRIARLQTSIALVVGRAEHSYYGFHTELHRITQEYAGLLEDWGQILPRLRRSHPGSWNEIKQRAFVAFLVPTDGSIPIDRLQRFCHLLIEHPNLVVKLDDALSVSFKYNHPLIESPDVTLVRESLTLEGLSSTPWIPWSGIAIESHQAETKEFLPRIVELVQPLEIEVVALSWNVDVDLQALIVEIAVSAGIQDTFSEL